MKLIKEMDMGTNSSLGNIWMTATNAFGWKALKDEGKIMGMAGNGNFNQKIYNSLKKIIKYKKGELEFGPSSSAIMSDVFFKNLQKSGLLTDKQFRFDIAYNLQKVTEEVMLEFIEDLISLYPDWSKRFCFAGGIFANVKMNQKINELDKIEEIWILPPMGDEGLALGSAICLSNEIGEWIKPKKLDNVFFGLEYTDEEILEESKNYDFISIDYQPNLIADFLIDGLIGAFFKGRFEYGPRSLGARSIIVQATDPKTHDLLNERLERNEVMPFAPAILSDRSEGVFIGAEKSKYAAEFMTVCYTVRENWINVIPACIHNVDNTGRPQFVNKETNKDWYELIEAYFKKTGIPVILNTSFNGHGEPIIDSPSQAFRHLEKGTIDFLIMENKIFLKK
jgi:carbamoyltransferase